MDAERLALTVEEAASLLGVSRNRASVMAAVAHATNILWVLTSFESLEPR